MWIDQLRNYYYECISLLFLVKYILKMNFEAIYSNKLKENIEREIIMLNIILKKVVIKSWSYNFDILRTKNRWNAEKISILGTALSTSTKNTISDLPLDGWRKMSR